MDTPRTFTKKHLSLVVLIAFVVGGVAGGIFGSVANVLFKNSRTIIQQLSSLPDKGEPIYQLQSDSESSVINVVEKANPAVVNIAIYKDISQFYNATGPNISPFDDFFEEFGFPFRFEFRQPQRSQPRNSEPQLQRVGGGSGFIIQADGLIVTNKHVVADEEAVYKVLLSNGQEFAAKVLARDPALDVALIDIEGENLPTVPLGDSDTLKIGQTVVAIGYALAEFGNTVTSGVVSGIGRRVVAGDGRGQSEVLDEAIQTDAAINPGNSGGPLLNLAGEVVGINTAVSQSGQSVGFAIPINSLKQTIESVQKTGRIVRPWLGVRYMPVTPRLTEENKLSITYGALIIRGQSAEELAVVPGSPADEAGLEENDIILEINGKKLEDKDSLAKEIGRHEVGEEVVLKILRKGEEREVKVRLEEFPAE